MNINPKLSVLDQQHPQTKHSQTKHMLVIEDDEFFRRARLTLERAAKHFPEKSLDRHILTTILQMLYAVDEDAIEQPEDNANTQNTPHTPSIEVVFSVQGLPDTPTATTVLQKLLAAVQTLPNSGVDAGIMHE